ncbi:hypothetical protein FAUST_11078 [Fusarium austroamericanum]|uniref:Polyketide synthase n=1 Tax=Fusarium austroamericanum TaxID=282268 RepID=A0AAN5YZH7_FUSAU|nr:hypothetical protein FAUST_11078 [Fusarium austroamericanum]
MTPSAIDTTNGVANGQPTSKVSVTGHESNGHGLNGSSSQQVYPRQELMAVCGMACRLPGDLASADELWEFLVAKKDARSRVPSSRYNVSAYYSPTPKPGTVATEYGNFLGDSVELGALDTSVFPLKRTELERADPQQRLMMEVAREAFEDAGITNWKGKPIGCYIGNYGEDWSEMFSKEPQEYGLHRITGTGDFALSNRLSYEFDITGPSVTIRTACSSSLVCLNEACAAINRGDCEAAVVGGLNLILNPSMTVSETEQGVLSRDGSCKSFSADANGYARGEAVTAVFVKPLAHALRDGNPVRAVIRAITNNSDGKTPGLSQPSTDSQETLIRRAYAMAGITDYSETAMVECHGTGTPIGDPIEAKAVARVFGGKGVYIGSIKPNLGHTEGASGLVSLIKMAKALEHRSIPPQIRFTSPNPNIPFEEAKLKVPLEVTPWPEDRLERISLNSFGVGGSNAHVILESAAMHGASTVRHETPEGPQLLLFSANSAKSLTNMVESYKDWIQDNPDSITDLAFTLARKRDHRPHRHFAIVNNGTVETVSPPTKIKSDQAPNVVMVFTGQGAQWPQMGLELLQSNPVFLSSIRSLDQHLQEMVGLRPDFTIEEELRKTPKKSRVSSAEISQPLCTAVQIALVDTLRSDGIVPSAVVGHSSGEIAAAYASGALTAAEAIIAAYCRGAVTTRQKRSGSMAAIGMGWEDTTRHLVPNVTIACDNSPKSVTISGDSDAVKAVVEDVKKTSSNVLARLLQVDKAYHSHHMAEIGEEYLDLIRGNLHEKKPMIPFFSSVTGKLLDEEQRLGPQYWRANLESPVRFRQAVMSILDHEVGKNSVYLEIGPHSALAGPLRQTLAQASESAPYISAMTRNQNSASSYLAAIGKCYSLNLWIDLEALFPSGSCLPDLPRYPWNHEDTYWFESRLSKEWRFRKFPYHNLLGLKVTESTDLEPMWRNLFHVSNVPWIRDHRVGEDIVFPFAGYISLAGEAVRQLTGIQEGYSVRNIIVNTALVLSEAKPTEMISTFRPNRLTTSLSSPWWEFTVSSHNGHIWTKHCTGEVMALSSSLGNSQDPATLPRKVIAAKWYGKMRNGGLDLGPSFQTLQTIETSTNDTEDKATGAVANGRQSDQDDYHIHPTVLDATIQILGAAATKGQMRKVKTWLPTSMDKFNVYRCSEDMFVNVEARLSSNFSVVGGGRCTSGGVVVVEAENVKMSLAEGALSAEIRDTHAAARCEWGPDLDFMDVRKLLLPPTGSSDSDSMHLLEELGQLCLLSSKRHLAGFESTDLHLQRYIVWLTTQAHSVVENLVTFMTALDNESISDRIEALMIQLADTPGKQAAEIIHLVYTNLKHVASGQALGDVIPSDTLDRLRDFADNLDLGQFLRYLRHSSPNLRVLEIGVHGASPSRDMINGLRHANGQVICSRYTFTLPGFISGKDQAQAFPNMEYMTLDVNEDPHEQGFENRQYDLIVARNILHSVANVQQYLANMKTILDPNGRLLMQERGSSSMKWIGYIFGVLPAWPLGSEEGQTSGPSPLSDTATWERELAAAGFGSIETIASTGRDTTQPSPVILARPNLPKETPKSVTVLTENPEKPLTQQVLALLERDGYTVTYCGLDDSPPTGQDVLSLLDLEKPFFDELDEARFQKLQTFVVNLGDVGILWLTSLSQIGCRNPQYAQILGFARTIRLEALAEFATCEIDCFENEQSLEMITRVLGKFQTRDTSDELNPDFEWAICDGEVQVGRFHPFALRDELLVSEPGEKASLDVGTPGRVNSLHWLRGPREVDLGPTDVEVQVHAVGLNFRDLLVALGIVELPIRQLGLEAAGYISRVGSNVDPEQLKVGDRICCLKKHAFGTYITVPSIQCIRIPDNVTFDESATMLMPYTTVIHGLFNVARLSKDQTVLIHSACGGVGLAAVQISQMVGADVFCTVGSEDKVDFLMNNFKIPRNRIFNSRDSSFVDGIMHETGGKGIDVILNSLSGQLLHATWACVAEFGTLVEIGKRDLIGRGKLDMEPFLKNRSYCCVDMDRVWEKPGVLRKLMTDAFEWYEKGLVTPIRPVHAFPAAQTADAFRFIQKGFHIGRVGVSVQHLPEGTEIPFETTKRNRPVEFSGSSSYLLVGGLGGLGRAISVWLVEHGAKELVYFSRNAGQGPTDTIFVAELESMGCHVKLVQGDVTKLEDVDKAVSAAALPLKGVIQMSMVLRDQQFADMTFDQWQAATRPKVQGTWNLHNATVRSGAHLDFFLMFSSISGAIGNPGQANYNSANTFLDAFAQYRKGQGLAASVVDIGAVEDIGVLAEQQGLLGLMKARGFKAVNEQELLDAMVVAMMVHASPSPTVPDFPFIEANTFAIGLGSSVSLRSSSSRAVWKKDRRMAVYHNMGSAGGEAEASNDSLKSFLVTAKSDSTIFKAPETAKFLALEIGKKLFNLLLKPEEDLNTSMPLVDLGLDSLVAIELKAWWKQVFAFDISVLEMMGKGSLDVLGQHAADGMLKNLVDGMAK